MNDSVEDFNWWPMNYQVDFWLDRYDNIVLVLKHFYITKAGLPEYGGTIQ